MVPLAKKARWLNIRLSLFAWAYQLNLTTIQQYFSLIINLSTVLSANEQGMYVFFPFLGTCSFFSL